jgi:signal peptidase II
LKQDDPRRRARLLPPVIAAVILIDQGLKLLVVRYFLPGQATASMMGFRLVYAQNTGVAFSFLDGSPMVLAIVISVILLACAVFLFGGKPRPLPQSVCLALVCAGGFSNLLDRFTRGFVVDYIDPTFVKFAVFNFADMVLTCSVFALAVFMIIETRQTARAETRD